MSDPRNRSDNKPGNALVPLAIPGRAQPHADSPHMESRHMDSRASSRPYADFIAHLIATSGRAPQTCSRRRAEPEEAVAAYGVLDTRQSRAGRILSRSL